MTHGFRASQGHLSCIPAVAIVVVWLIPATPRRHSRLRQTLLRAPRATSYPSA